MKAPSETQSAAGRDQNYAQQAADFLRNEMGWMPGLVLAKAIAQWESEAVNEMSDMTDNRSDARVKAGLVLRWHKWQRLLNESNPMQITEIHKSFTRIRNLLGVQSDPSLNPILHWVAETEFRHLPNDIASMNAFLNAIPMPSHLFDPSLQDQPGCRKQNLWGSFKTPDSTQKSHFWKFANRQSFEAK